MGNDNFSMELPATETLDAATGMQKVHLFTHGQMNARDGRVFYLDNPEGVIAETMRRAGKVEIAIDFEHQGEFSEKNGQPAPAAGWIKSLEVRDDGIWALVQWTKQAAAMIANQQYRYISPTFKTVKGGVIWCIMGAGLTNNPALELTHLAQNQKGAKDARKLATRAMLFQAKIAELLGLEGEADEATILGALEGLLDEYGGIGGAETTAIASLLSDLSQERQQTQMARVNDKVSNVIAKAIITPALRGWATRLCSQDEAAFDEFIANIGPGFSRIMKGSGISNLSLEKGNIARDADSIIAKQLGIDPTTMKG